MLVVYTLFRITAFFLSLISLPLLIAWGLPFSLMSVVGNLVFSPLLMLFLTFSSLLFFSELMHIPNALLAYCLEGIAYIWQFSLSVRQPSWLIGFVKLPIIVLCSIVLVALWIVSRRMWYARTRIIAFLSVFTLLWSASWMSSGTVPVITTCACNKGSVIIIYYHNKTVLIDPGYIGQRPSASSWVQYTLAPYIIQLTGSVAIDYMIVLQPSSRLFEALAGLCTKLPVSQVYMPWWRGTLSPGAWRNFFVFKEMLARTGGTIKRFGDWPIKISLPNQSYLRLLPLGDLITYHEAQYADTRVDCCIDKEVVTFYAAKHRDTVDKKGSKNHEKSIINCSS